MPVEEGFITRKNVLTTIFNSVSETDVPVLFRNDPTTQSRLNNAMGKLRVELAQTSGKGPWAVKI